MSTCLQTVGIVGKAPPSVICSTISRASICGVSALGSVTGCNAIYKAVQDLKTAPDHEATLHAGARLTSNTLFLSWIVLSTVFYALCFNGATIPNLGLLWGAATVSGMGSSCVGILFHGWRLRQCVKFSKPLQEAKGVSDLNLEKLQLARRTSRKFAENPSTVSMDEAILANRDKALIYAALLFSSVVSLLGPIGLILANFQLGIALPSASIFTYIPQILSGAGSLISILLSPTIACLRSLSELGDGVCESATTALGGREPAKINQVPQ